MTPSRIAGLSGALVAACAAAGVGAAPAAAQPLPCPDIEVVFARGTSEPPGVGGVGQAFVDSVRAQAGGRTVGVYPVNYPAGNNFADRVAFGHTVVDGIRDEANRVQIMSQICPNTRMVLGGFSQGAAVTSFVASDTVPNTVPPEVVPPPMAPELIQRVDAVVLFGTPAGVFLEKYGATAIPVGPLYAEKTLLLCAPGDSVCDGIPNFGPNPAHGAYPVNGMVHQGAAFAVGRLQPLPPPPPPPPPPVLPPGPMIVAQPPA